MMNDYKLELAQRYTEQGNYHAAIDLLKELLAQAPNEALYHGLLAVNLLAQTRIHAAEYELKLALNLDPNLGFLYTTSARVNLLKCDYNSTFELCNEALRLDPQDYDALLIQSQVHRLLNKFSESLKCINQAAQIAPNAADIIAEYADHYYEQGKLEEALDYTKQALSIDTQSTSTNNLMAKIQLALNNVAEAEYHAKFVMLQDPDNHSALQMFVNIKMNQNLVFGLWWKFNNKLANMSNLMSSIALISAYLFFTLAAQITKDLGYSLTSIIISFSWLAFVIYTWVGIPYYNRKLKKELEKFSFNPNY